MENKTMNSQESFDIIREMIAQTRGKLEQGGGTIFLIWGYTSVIVTIAIVALLILTKNPNVQWLWWAIPIIGWTCMGLVIRKQPKTVSTYIDKFISNIWWVLGISCTLIPMMALVPTEATMMIVPIEALLLSIGTTITGLTLGFRPLTIGGSISMALSLAMFLCEYDVYLFVIMFIVSMIIPGHILNHRAKCSKS